MSDAWQRQGEAGHLAGGLPLVCSLPRSDGCVNPELPKASDSFSGEPTSPEAGPERRSTGTENRRKLAGNLVALYILQGLNYAIPMAVLPYLVRVLGMQMYGLIAFSQSFAQYFTLLTDYGFNYSATRSIALQGGNGAAISRIFSSVLTIKVALMCAGAVVVGMIVATVPRFHHDAIFFLVAYLAVAGNVLFPLWYFQGVEEMRQISAIYGGARLLGAVALFVWVHHPSDALRALVIQSLAVVLAGAVGLGWVLFSCAVRFVLPGRTELATALKEGAHLFVSTAAISLYTNTNVFLVGILAGNTEAGYFSAAERLVRAMQGLITPVTQAVFPHMNAIAAESRKSALRLAKRTLKWMSGISFFFSVTILVLAGPIVVLCFGHHAAPCVPVIRWIALLPLLVAVSNVLGIQTMITFNLDRQFSLILVLAGIFNAVIAIPLVHFFAATGAGAAVLCTEFLVTVSMWLILERHGIRILAPERSAA